MALSDFATRMFGYNPFDTNSSGQPIQLPGATMANTASIAQPTLEQSYQDDLRQAQMDRVGNLGMLLLAAGQQLTPAQRATILAQAPQYMDGAQRDAATAAQARLLNMQNQASQQEISRSQALQDRLKDPAFINRLGLTPETAQALGPAGIQKLIENQAMANTPDNVLDRRVKQAQLEKLSRPELTPEQEAQMRETGAYTARRQLAETMPNLSPAQRNELITTGKINDTIKPPNAEQASSQTFLKMMDQAEQNISQVPAMAGAGRVDRALDSIPFGHGFTSNDYQKADQAQRQFIQAWLRKTSGAAISPAEFEAEGRKFFPQPGDGPDVIAQKAEARKAAREGLLMSSSPTFQQDYQPPQIRQPGSSIPGVKSIRQVN